MSCVTRVGAAAAVLAIGLLLGACRHTPAGGVAPSTTAKAADTLEVERLLVSTQQRATPDLDVRDPSCPARVVVTNGATFECTVVVEGIVVPYKVTLANVDNPSQTGRYDIRPAKAVILVPRIVEALGRATSAEARIDCGPDKVKVLDPGMTMRCLVTDAGGQRVETLRVDDVLGNVSRVTGS